MKKANTLIAIIMIIGLFVVGCSPDQSTTTSDITTDTASEDVTPTQNIPAEDSTASDMVVEVETKSNKSESEQMDDALAQIIADGTYVDEQAYMSPGGEEDIRVTLTVEKDIITDVAMEGFGELHKNSARYIAGVAMELPSLVIGKSIDQIDELPTNIAGSSLTVAAFKESVADIVKAN